jgi:hypothetical protein
MKLNKIIDILKRCCQHLLTGIIPQTSPQSIRCDTDLPESF